MRRLAPLDQHVVHIANAQLRRDDDDFPPLVVPALRTFFDSAAARAIVTGLLQMVSASIPPSTGNFAIDATERRAHTGRK